MSTDAALALHRFGVGARPGELAHIARDPRDALRAQLENPEAALIRDETLPSSAAAALALAGARMARKAEKEAGQAPMKPPEEVDLPTALASGDPGLVRRTVYRSEVAARLRHGATTDAGFVERLVLFWSNHFAVSAAKGPVHVLAGAMEREAIRPNVLGRFADLLQAVEQHPAMLIYLDNQLSVGPNSRAGLRNRKGLNENLAREILELHTLGADAGYSQEDVTTFAKVLTGWSLRGPNSGRDDAGHFVFFPERHEPGRFRVFGRDYAPSGAAQGVAVLEDLAQHPATARHIAVKLARHFIADTPPESAVRRLTTAYLDSGGDLAVVSATLLACPEAWNPAPAKVKSPYDFVLSAARLNPDFLADDKPLLGGLNALGQRPFAPPSPKGWPDDSAAWLAPHSFKERLDWSALMAERYPPAVNPAALAEDAFGEFLSDATRQEVARAATGAQGLTLLLMSPEFQRR